jgi:hypothetical protein
VGVATRDDLLVVSLEAPAEGLPAAELLRRLNGSAPRGMTFRSAEALGGKGSARPRKVRYELPSPTARRETVRHRLRELKDSSTWPVERRQRGRRGAAVAGLRVIDLKPLVAEIELRRDRLDMVLVPKGDAWARPGEVLALLGLDERQDLADLVRTELDCELPRGQTPLHRPPGGGQVPETG